VAIGKFNFASEFVDHGANVPPGTPPGSSGAMQYVPGALKKFPDLQTRIEEIIPENDRVVVRNRSTATSSQTGKALEFRGIVIWRIAARQLAERWAFLEPPHSP
jgi:predicted ester cyclase